jgi:DNA-binding MarR family transcriptional regulator
MNAHAPVKHPPAAPSPCNGSALRKATRRLSQLYDSVLAPCGLKLSQYSVLVHIERAGTPNMGDLARDMVLDRSALSHNMKPLERDGFVEMLPDEHDKRGRRVALTAAGKSKLAASKALWAEAQRRFESAYGADKAAQLRTLLTDVFSDEVERLFNEG